MQVAVLERKQNDDLAHGEIETAHPGYLGSQDTFYVGTLKGVGRIYLQTFVGNLQQGRHGQALHDQDADYCRRPTQ